MSKFKVGDKVRVNNQDCAYHGHIGTVLDTEGYLPIYKYLVAFDEAKNLFERNLRSFRL